jgi:hypothetical protein
MIDLCVRSIMDSTDAYMKLSPETSLTKKGETYILTEGEGPGESRFVIEFEKK